MEPAFKSGSFALVRVGTKHYKIGDVIIFKTSNALSLKRIRDISSQGYFVTGDNANDSVDSRDSGLVLVENIIGKVLWW